MFGGNFAPAGWAFCDGRTLPIDQFEALFALIGTTYGGDGQTTFNLPDLQGRLPIHQGTLIGNGSTFVIGQMAGTENETLNIQQIPIHNHQVIVSAAPGSVSDPSGAHLAQDRDFAAFGTALDQNYSPMNAQSLTISGGSQPHNNLPPYLCVSFIISLFGIFPSQN